MIEINIVQVLCFMTIGHFHQGIAAPIRKELFANRGCSGVEIQDWSCMVIISDVECFSKSVRRRIIRLQDRIVNSMVDICSERLETVLDK